MEKKNTKAHSLSQPKTKKELFVPKVLAVARSNYGKSYVIAHLINKWIDERLIEPKRILVFSKTWKTDDSQAIFIDRCEKAYPKFRDKNCFENVDMKLLTMLYDAQKKIKEDGRQLHPYLLFFDDQIGDNSLCSKGKDSLLSYLSLCRHFGIGTIVCMQQFKCMIPGIRSQMTHVLIGQLSSSSQTEDILKEFDAGLAKNKKEAFKIISDWYHDAVETNQNRGFLFIDLRKTTWQGQKFQQNITGPFYDLPEKKTY